MARGVRRFTSARVVVWLVIGVALLSIATGLVTTATGPTGGGLFGGLIPRAVRQATSYTGTIVGFLLLVAAVGLRRGLRAAWYASAILLPVTAIHGLLQSTPYSLPLVVFSLLTLPALFLVRTRFQQPVELSAAQVATAAAVVGAQLYGTIGAYALRTNFADLNTWFDAFYFTLITASTVGYGDIHPTTTVARAFGMTVIVFGAGSFAAALGVLFAPILENSFASALGKSTNTNINLMEDHLLVLGYGHLLTESILDELDGGTEYVVVAEDSDLVEDLREAKKTVIHGDPSDEDVLQRVGIDRAKSVLVATEDDAADSLAVLTARQLNPDIRIVAAATERENVRKLRRAGADIVVSPALIGRMLVQAALGGEHVEELAAQLAGEPSNRTLDDF
ncbi:NAD-binding protein 2 (Kef-type transporter subunit) [Haladaptatus paucihalophilus DX253]|uniref:NAD-binding protein 2 ( Kef-type transporter subunit) n=1 Tax=Haladaptatus paucihalophilus DX253 TaxID=797209 RepID=E7QNH9_HALPU|nr:NAD-binding protein [Haladaptatus paucihalophilus]EFW94049.1 NAD-binding protein 2 (Kef-type transporter subunit) [Haladaptatus paucihalophilus DX253]SHK63358.1 voltage-gated potassium channel [Haladaptatus paucihalophilus DX253]